MEDTPMTWTILHCTVRTRDFRRIRMRMYVLRSVDRFKNSTHMDLRVSWMVIGRIPKTKDWNTLSMLSLKRSVPEVGG